MTDKEQLEFILRILRLVQPMDCDDILWVTHGEYAPVAFMVNCSDLFYWASADSEDVTPENISELEKAYSDAKAACEHGRIYAQSLFACRMRKMRPQGACYKSYPAEMWPLFDACGPEREVTPGNTPKPLAPSK